MRSSVTRNCAIDLAKFIAIICVLIYHGTLYEYDFLSGGSLILYASRTVLSAGVPLFFLVNGFLLFGKSFDYMKHLIRTVKLLGAVLFWSVVQMIFLLL